VKVNWVEADPDFLDAWCCRILMFSCPLDVVTGTFSAFAVAIDSEMIPEISSNGRQ
jgi:hypothetical protein